MVNDTQGGRFASAAMTGRLLKAARVLSGLSAQDLAARTHLGIATIKRAEAIPGPVRLTEANAQRIIEALFDAGIELIPENGGGLGVRLREHGRPQSESPAAD